MGAKKKSASAWVQRLKRNARQARNDASALLVADVRGYVDKDSAEHKRLEARGLVDWSGHITPAGRKAAAGIRQGRADAAADVDDINGRADREHGPVDKLYSKED